MVLFGAHSKSPNTTKIEVLADTRENPKRHFWLQKCHFGFSLEKGLYYLWYLKAVLCWKHYFYSVFSKTQLCRHERMQLEQKQTFTKNRGCLPKCKKVFFWYVFCVFWWFCFLLPVFLFLCFVKGPKRLFSCNFRVFLSILFPPKACLKVFFFFLFCFFLLLSSLSKIHFLFAFYPSTPFYRRLFLGFLFFFFCLPFPFLRFACLFDTNFPNIPFLKSNVLSFLAVSFFCCSSCCFDCVCFSLSVSLLLCWLCVWCLFV